MAHTAEAELREEIKPNTTHRLPTLVLRWSHTEIDKDLCFEQNTHSMFHKADPAADILCVTPAKQNFLYSSILRMTT